MSGDRKIKEAVEQLAGTQLKDKVKFVDCTVDSVDINAGTCTATPIGENSQTQIIGIELEAEVCDGLLIIPVVGSTISVIYSTRNTPYVYKFSDIDAVYYSGNTWQFGDGTFGGLIKVIELTQKLNNAENILNKLITVLNGWTPVPNDGGAALKALITALSLTNFNPTAQSEIENTTVTHGD